MTTETRNEAAAKCFPHTHLWSDVRRRYVREETCRRHHFNQIEKAGPRRGLAVALDSCRYCGEAA